MLTKQEIFDTVKTHLLKQNARAINGIMCKYRTDAGLKCAAGVLIKDEFYTPELESHSAKYSIVQEALEKSGVSEDDIPFVIELQRIHDFKEIAEWPLELSLVAAKNNLGNHE